MGRDPRARRRSTSGSSTRLHRASRCVSFFRKSKPPEVRDAGRSAVAYMGFAKSYLISIVNVFGVIDWNLPIFKYNLDVVPVRDLHRRLDGALGPPLLRPDLRLRRADAVDGRRRCPSRLRCEPPLRLEQRAAWIKYAAARRRRRCTSS